MSENIKALSPYERAEHDRFAAAVRAISGNQAIMHETWEAMWWAWQASQSRYRKLLAYMTAGRAETWLSVEQLASVGCHVSYEELERMLDDLPELSSLKVIKRLSKT